MSSRGPAEVVLAIDGGNIKTDVALADRDGRLLAFVRGGTSSPHALGFDGCIEVLSELVSDAQRAAGMAGAPGEPAIGVARVLLAGADLPEEVDRLQSSLNALGWSRHLLLENDTLALLRTGTDRGWGVAVVCGGGINAVGITQDGRTVQFPALGAITGDWGGGHDVGMAALGAAHRSADGRGPRSALEHAVPDHFGLRTPLDVTLAFHYKEISLEALAQLTPVVYAHAESDQVAREILERNADEVVVLAKTCLRRLKLEDAGADVVIGGGLMRAAPPWLLERIEQGVHASSPSATVVLAYDGPIVGATILGLDEIDAGTDAITRARIELQRAIVDLGKQPVA